MTAEIKSGHSALDLVSRDLVERGLAVWSADAAARPVLIVRGQANLLDEAALGDIERVRSLLDDLENKQSVAELLERARKPMRPGYLSARKTGCSHSRVLPLSRPRTATAREKWSECWG